MSVIGVSASIIIVGLIVIYYRRYLKRAKNPNPPQQVSIFGEKTFRKYVVTNNQDPEIGAKI